ncbi:hypothetical protein AKJ37_01405 [candidate division MSBL1 archaeon SCGC-AAA259I09]|uniref:Small ribosomal subunit protein eS1 n=3 Tax=candidate division MSBL1 TaxID=215777 RepID=A0A133UVD5_9EURY|nr:hypothetical protein AKJ61_03950 [candidate division MSBL1 archaeon SCGC-AAA259B11]KXA90591.1 hypothetical protein AKJ62_00540 [candidate division MSBL1 archaeon SCGC-AAA259D14]KXA98090.1 hypothetical protein AKJ37_01405 [candidate division MSBL1 archaeon SCGC-AAA259I09]
MARPKRRDGWRAKKWYDIHAPSMFGSMKIGETLASEPEKVEGRVMETTLGQLIDDFSKNHIKIYLKIKEVEDSKAKTEFMGHDMSREYIRSQVRRRATKVDCITDVTTPDDRKLRITSIAVTLNRTKGPQKKAIQKRMEKYIKERTKDFKFEQLAQQMVLGKFASDIYKNIKDICPIRRVEVKKSKVLGKK